MLPQYENLFCTDFFEIFIAKAIQEIPFILLAWWVHHSVCFLMILVFSWWASFKAMFNYISSELFDSDYNY